MSGIRRGLYFRAIPVAGTLLAALASAAPTVHGATVQAAALVAQALPGVVVTANPTNVLVEFSVVPVDQISIYRNDKTYKMQNDTWVKQDFSSLKDYVALVCIRTSEKDGGLGMGVPSIAGVKRVDATLKQQLNGGRYSAVAMASRGFEQFFAASDLKGKPIGFLGAGQGTVLLIWLMPNVPGSYEVSGLNQDKKSVVGIRIE